MDGDKSTEEAANGWPGTLVGVFVLLSCCATVWWQAYGSENAEFIQVEPDGSDSWRVQRACELLQQGEVGIIPTDTLPAFVVDLHNRDAVAKLYR